jgi:23S rRNA maturation mini-RNase III
LHKAHSSQDALARRRAALVNQMTARLMRESDRIAKRGAKGAEATKELNAAFYSAQKDFYKVVNSGYTIPYPAR